ncbi:Aspartate racemase [Rhodovulum sp. PH10]|uniref:aspartate/glutamate racemase family protein n=1 Tax=Rhodovulum sp. PH10 TaxID=1187851 RepID=UPI00027C2B15|nr:aspartate/glutamate racemase family protein [Rhodovulum sp. PH10]EJW12550.1 Aspartate racemase [Rhodovulum sp. PH10]
MRTIGLIGGMSWESTQGYYRRINEQVRERRGGLRSADILMRSVDFEEVAALQRAGDWDGAGRMLAGIAKNLEQGGAGCVLICTNTMHKVADAVERAIGVPLVHIVDATAEGLRRAGAKKPLLLATRFTMEEAFYRGRMRERYGIEALVPETDDRAMLHHVIFDELCRGVVEESSREKFRTVIARGREQGADSVILGCTEIGMLIGAADSVLPVFDSTLLHADAAVDFALAEKAAAA